MILARFTYDGGHFAHRALGTQHHLPNMAGTTRWGTRSTRWWPARRRRYRRGHISEIDISEIAVDPSPLGELYIVRDGGHLSFCSTLRGRAPRSTSWRCPRCYLRSLRGTRAYASRSQLT